MYIFLMNDIFEKKLLDILMRVKLFIMMYLLENFGQLIICLVLKVE